MEAVKRFRRYDKVNDVASAYKASFKTCGLTTAADGSEGDIIHCFKADDPIPRLFEKHTVNIVKNFADILELADADEDDENGYFSDDGHVKL
ncbi:hypothetical protein AAVH_29228 [Aphelenchoides avenae]|nr:hypothetical protein AAVH_29228 [Aphelenchus avenae]